MVREGTPGDLREHGVRAYARWRKAQSRYDLLLSVFDKDECIDAAIERGRYLRLCSQIAIASEIADSARQDLVAIIDDVGQMNG